MSASQRLGLNLPSPLLIFSIVLFWGFSSFAQMSVSPPNVISEQRSILTIGGTMFFEVQRGLNDNGNMEVVVLYQEPRFMIPDTKVPVIYGRDIDEDGLPELWLIPDGNGMVHSVIRETDQVDGWDIMPYLLFQEVRLQERSALSLLGNAVFSALTFVKVKQDIFFQDIMAQVMNLTELEARLEVAKQNGATPRQLLPYYEIASRNWTEICERFDREIWVESAISVGDGALFVVAPKLIGKAAGWLVKQQARFVLAATPYATRLAGWLGARSTGAWIAKLYRAMRAGVSARAGASLETLKTVMGKPSLLATRGMEVAATSLFGMLAREQTKYALRALGARTGVQRVAARFLSWAFEKTSQGIVKSRLMVKALNPLYILQTAGVNIVAELMNRNQAFAFGTPIEIERNKKEMTQNVTYMAAETTVQSMIHSGFPASEAFKIAGVMSFTNSIGVSFLTNGEPNGERQALDTKWEVSVGNIQTKFDLEALKLFETAAAKNPRLMLVGYAIALTDQLAGYFAYSKVTQWLARNQAERANQNPHPHPNVILIPLMEEMRKDQLPSQYGKRFY